MRDTHTSKRNKDKDAGFHGFFFNKRSVSFPFLVIPYNFPALKFGVAHLTSPNPVNSDNVKLI